MPLSPRIQNIFEKTKTICLGRFIVVVPESAKIIYGPANVPWPINNYPGKGAQMEKVISDRLIEIRDEPKYLQGDLRLPSSLVGKVFDGALPNQKIVFGVSKGSGGFYRIESYTKIGDDLFIQESDSIPKKNEQDVRELNSIAPLLRSRGELEIPAEPGICIEDGFIRTSTAISNEDLSIGVRLTEFPDVHFSFSVHNKKYVASDAIEPRLKQAEEDAKRNGNGAWYARIKTLRRGQRTIGKWTGFEILAHMPAQAEVGETHEFAYLSHGEPGDPFIPMLDIKLSTGVKGNQIGGGKPSITDEEAVALWDKLTNSIRVRPTKEAAKQSAVPNVALGTLAQSGTVCPQSGWWESKDGDRDFQVAGGARQHFTQGVRMPNAILIATPSIWQKLKLSRASPRASITAVWTLVEIDPPPQVNSTQHLHDEILRKDSDAEPPVKES